MGTRRTAAGLVMGSLLAGLLAFAPAASADESTGIIPTDAVGSSGGGGGRVITISEVTIVGRVQKPIASVDVNKIQPKLTLAELRQPFLDRIEAATRKDPF